MGLLYRFLYTFKRFVQETVTSNDLAYKVYFYNTVEFGYNVMKGGDEFCVVINGGFVYRYLI